MAARRATRILALGAASGAILSVTMGLALGDPALLMVGAIAAVMTVWILVVGRVALRGHAGRAIGLMSAGSFVSLVLTLPAIPHSASVLALVSLVPVFLAIPYLDARRMRLYSAAVWVFGTGYVIVAELYLLALGSAHPFGLSLVFEIVSVGWVMALFLVFLNLYHRTSSAMRHAAFRDGLTGLHNSTLFLDRVEHALTRARRRGTTVAVVYLDVDSFKEINDRHGHGQGDLVLREVAQRLRAAVRASDTVARVGGDEFAVLLEDLATREDGVGLADRLFDSMSEPIPLAGDTLIVRLSAGIAFDDGADATAEALLQDADHAMYRAKRSRSGEPLVFEPSFRTSAEKSSVTERTLGGAAERDEPPVRYQPVIRLGHGARGVPLGYDLGQGYLLARPMDAADVGALLTASRRAPWGRSVGQTAGDPETSAAATWRGAPSGALRSIAVGEPPDAVRHPPDAVAQPEGSMALPGYHRLGGQPRDPGHVGANDSNGRRARPRAAGGLG